MTTFLMWPRRTGKNWMIEQLKRAGFDNCDTVNTGHMLIGTIVGKFEGLTVIFDDLTDTAAPAPKQHRIQHGPVRKGRGGKPKRW